MPPSTSTSNAASAKLFVNTRHAQSWPVAPANRRQTFSEVASFDLPPRTCSRQHEISLHVKKHTQRCCRPADDSNRRQHAQAAVCLLLVGSLPPLRRSSGRQLCPDQGAFAAETLCPQLSSTSRGPPMPICDKADLTPIVHSPDLHCSWSQTPQRPPGNKRPNTVRLRFHTFVRRADTQWCCAAQVWCGEALLHAHQPCESACCAGRHSRQCRPHAARGRSHPRRHHRARRPRPPGALTPASTNACLSTSGQACARLTACLLLELGCPAASVHDATPTGDIAADTLGL